MAQIAAVPDAEMAVQVLADYHVSGVVPDYGCDMEEISCGATTATGLAAWPAWPTGTFVFVSCPDDCSPAAGVVRDFTTWTVLQTMTQIHSDRGATRPLRTKWP